MAIKSFFKKIVGNKAQKDLKKLIPLVEPIHKESGRVKKLSNDELRAETETLKSKISDFIKPEKKEIQELKQSIEYHTIDEREKIYQEIDNIEKSITNKLKEILNELLPTTFAIVKETAKRFFENEKLVVKANNYDKQLAAKHDFVKIEKDNAVYLNSWVAGGNKIQWDMVHYDVQLIGGIVLHQGKVAEMATGEGKTLVATLPVFLNALSGHGVHIVTVNDYLAKRDAEWMGPIYQFHGFTVDCIDKHQPNSYERKMAYNADVTFGTNNEFGFDYLRDNMAINPDDLVQRKHNFAIVDEVDSVLIDDARTPLIISGPVPKGDNQLFNEFKPSVERVVRAQRTFVHSIFTKAKKLIESDNSKEKTEGALLLFRTFKGLPRYKPLIKFLSEQGNKALLHKTENHYMADNNKNMYIATDPLYFVIDEKLNSIELTDKGIDLLSGDTKDSDFFILPDIGSRISEIEKSDLQTEKKIAEKDKLIQDYAVKSERVHTVNQLFKAYTLFEKDVEYVLMGNKVKIVDEQTGRIMEGRRYSDGLHQAIEAKENVTVEAATQTYATITLQNYFRLYEKLSGMTGTAETEAGELWDIYKLDVVIIPTNKPIIRSDKNDFVYKTKREKFNAVIDEIGKLIKAGRPVLVGTTSVEVSELLSRMLKIRGIKHNVLNAKRHKHEADIVAEAGETGTVTIATNMAGRGTDIKLQRQVKEAGGLAIVGTERHEARRVDRQLRGRSGRQGDNGSSQFFVSLEDDLLRLFGSERVIKIMDRLGLKDGEVIQSKMITNQIERAQRKVEENNFGIRKRLLEYDDVMNSQREVIYTKRKHALLGERLSVDISNTMYDTCEALLANYLDINDEEFKNELIRIFSIEFPFENNDTKALVPEELAEKLFMQVRQRYKRKTEIICEQTMPVIKDVFQNRHATFKNIVIPITDGLKVYNVITNLEKAYETKGNEIIKNYEKTIVLSQIDEAWKEHLREMDDLKQSVQTASYEQKDPLLIYKFEAFNLFKQMVNETNRNIISSLMKGQVYLPDPENLQEGKERKTDMSNLQTQKEEFSGNDTNNNERKVTEPVRVEKKVGRNDACPCGSGKKYKNCHGKN